MDFRELQPQEWVYWQAIESESESIDGNGNWGLVHYTSDGSEEYEITRKFHAMRQYTNFIRPGDEFVYTSNRKTTSSYDPDSKELTLVTYNDKDTAVDVSYDLSKFGKIGKNVEVYRTSPTEERATLERAKTGGDALTVSLAPQSITTFVLPVSGVDEVLVANGDFETGAAGQNPVGWLTRGGDAYGSYLNSDYTQAGGGETGLQEAVHYSGGNYDVYTYQRKELENGLYTLRALVRANPGPSTSEMVVSGYGGERRSVPIPVGEEGTQIEIADIRVTDGKIEFGFHSVSAARRFITFDEVQLLRQ